MGPMDQDQWNELLERGRWLTHLQLGVVAAIADEDIEAAKASKAKETVIAVQGIKRKL